MHQDQLATGMYVGTNHPAPGTPMGPLWQAQKQSKVDFLQCIIGKICVAGLNLLDLMELDLNLFLLKVDLDPLDPLDLRDLKDLLDVNLEI